MKRTIIVGLLAAGMLLGAVALAHTHTTMAGESAGAAIAVIAPASGQHVHGVVRLTRVSDGVRITAHLQGLQPNSQHGFHIHQYGDCSAPDYSSAGGHYNPGHHRHGASNSSAHHAGDLGNIRADAEGDINVSKTVDYITIAGDKAPVLGRSVIVHAKADDLESQPSGAAGSRIGCGVIGLTQN